MSRADSFNDREDCLPAYNYNLTIEDAKPHTLRWAKEKGFPPDYAEKVSAFMAEFMAANPNIVKICSLDTPGKMQKNIGVSCFTSNPRNPVMWEKYGDNHRGLCLCFDLPDNQSALTLPRGKTCDGPIQIYPVIYTDDRPHPKLMNKSGDFMELCRVVVTKAKKWEYEQEWRIITVRYIGPAHYKPSDLRGIILGSQMPEAHVQEVLEIVNSLKTPIALFRAKTKADDSAVDIELSDVFEG